MHIDPWILTFSAVTVIATIWVGFWSARRSKTASDFYVAGRSVSVGWNASAISGEYLSAASFMGVAGMVMSSGYDALWYPVCYACGYLFLLLFIAGPLRRFGAYTIPDFAEGRYDSPVFRKIAVVFVLFIGFFYTMPQMKGAGTTLAYIFPGLPYWAGVVLVGAVITLNVALGGMKGITLVQAFQYWAKMFAISVPIFVLMAVYGHYGKQLGADGNVQHPTSNMRFPTNAPTAALNVESSRLSDRVQNIDPVTNSFHTINIGRVTEHWGNSSSDGIKERALIRLEKTADKLALKPTYNHSYGNQTAEQLILYFLALRATCGQGECDTLIRDNDLSSQSFLVPAAGPFTCAESMAFCERLFETNGILLKFDGKRVFAFGPKWASEANKVAAKFVSTEAAGDSVNLGSKFSVARSPLSEKAPADSTWLSPFGPLTTKAAKAAKPRVEYKGELLDWELPLPDYLFSKPERAVRRTLKSIPGLSDAGEIPAETNDFRIVASRYVLGQILSEPLNNQTNLTLKFSPSLYLGKMELPRIRYASGKDYSAQIKRVIESQGMTIVREPENKFTFFANKEARFVPIDPRPYSLLYTYSLIIALVCGTAGLPHILVRFYTNPDGVAAKRTTMWVMILIGIFYVFPPVFGVMGRNLLPDLYAGVGAKGTDKIVLELPRILNERYAPLGSILSGITCAGAFAAFMSTFSGLLVSMTGALAHDVYGRMFKPKSTPEQRLRAFKVCTVLIGGVAIVLGCFVEPLEINFMVGQAFAIAAASYFPLLFMSVWWRGMTMRGAATGMLTGGLCALAAVTLTNVSNLALDKGPMGKVFAGFAPLNPFWAAHPLLRILCEQPAIWTVPLAIGLMIVTGKLTSRAVPSDTRLKMLVLHAPEKLGLKQEYIQEHQHGH
jgi:Na+(H+)/acetate symporter ActP